MTPRHIRRGIKDHRYVAVLFCARRQALAAGHVPWQHVKVFVRQREQSQSHREAFHYRQYPFLPPTRSPRRNLTFCSFAQISERHVAVVGFWRQAARVRRLRNLHSAVELFEPERRQGRSCITICVYLLILFYATIQRPNFLPPSRLMRLASLN